MGKKKETHEKGREKEERSEALSSATANRPMVFFSRNGELAR